MDTPIIPTSDQSVDEAAAPGRSAPQTASAAAAVPPSGNTGGKLWEYTDPDTGERYLICPKFVGRPEIDLIPLPADGFHPYSAITDYLNCTFRFNPDSEPLTALFGSLFALLGDKFAPAIDRNRGLHGYKRSYQLGDSSAFFAFGGQCGTAFLSLPGEACSLVSDWSRVVAFLRDEKKAHITRWDGAVDDFFGNHSLDYAVTLYQAGLFNSGGNAPSCNQNGNWIKPDGRGRTFYVGKRQNGKMLRVYEKGMQLGSVWHPWVRWEIEVHNTDRIVPWEVLTEPGRYFVGAYPKALNWVQDEMSRIQTIKRQTTLSYEHLASYASMSWGPFFNTMLKVEGSPEAVLKRLYRPGTPRRLQHPYADEPSNYVDPEIVSNRGEP